MRDFRVTLFLALALLALGAYVSTIDMPARKADTAQREEARRLLRFDYRNVTRLVYATRAERIEMRRDERHRWRIVAPIAARGDARAIGGVLRALEIGRVARVIQDDGSAPGQYGLRAPRVTIDVTAGAYSETLALGNTGPLSSTLYARRGSEERVLLTTLSVVDFRNNTLDTFRLKDIVLFDPAEVEQIQLRAPDHAIDLQRGTSFHGSTAAWHVTAPMRAPADPTAVGVFLMTLRDLHATGFIDAQADKQALLRALRDPWLTATVRTRRRSHSVAFFAPTAAGGDAYAVTSAEEPMYRIPVGILDQLPREAFRLQDKRLFGMEGGDVALLTVRAREWRYTLIRQHGEWRLEGRESERVNQETVSLFVSRLADLPAEVVVGATTRHADRHALDPPAIEIVGLDRKGRRRGHLALGARGKGLVYAMGAGLPGIYQARSVILTQLPAPDALLEHDAAL